MKRGLCIALAFVVLYTNIFGLHNFIAYAKEDINDSVSEEEIQPSEIQSSESSEDKTTLQTVEEGTILSDSAHDIDEADLLTETISSTYNIAEITEGEEEECASDIEFSTIEYLEESNELLQSYLEYYAFADEMNQISPYAGNFFEDSFEGFEKLMYDNLKTKVIQVAAGETENTRVSVDIRELVTFQYGTADLGLDYDDLKAMEEKERKSTLVAAMNKAFEKQYFDYSKVVNAVLRDCPYECYWVDIYYAHGIDKYTYKETSTDYIVKPTSLVIYFCPSADYAQDGTIKTTTVDVSKTVLPHQAIGKAKQIVQEAENKSDVDKLDYYIEQICSLTAYNNEATSSSYEKGYGNPWQMIYVFDADPNTKVVCEGYAKAFQYLCELTVFESDIYTITVTGNVDFTSSKGGAHMWNILHMDNGKNYLVDVTNCDGYVIDKWLFMLPCSEGDVSTGYRFQRTGSNYFYTYSNETLNLYTEEDLTLSSQMYQPPQPNLDLNEKDDSSNTDEEGGEIGSGNQGNTGGGTGGQGDNSGSTGGNQEKEEGETDEKDGYGEIFEQDRYIPSTEDSTEILSVEDIPQELWVAGLPAKIDYSGIAITFPNLHVYWHTSLLKEGTDYTLKYTNNVKAGMATITITGKRNYTGKITKQFYIEPLSLEAMYKEMEEVQSESPRAIALDVAKSYNKKVQKATTTVTYNVAPNGTPEKWITLKNGTDYFYEYNPGSNYLSPGTYQVTVVGKGNYKDSITFTEEIVDILESEKKLLTDKKIKVSLDTSDGLSATGLPIEPPVIIYDESDGTKQPLEEGMEKDYTVTYQNNILPGTASVIIKGTGEKYTGSKILTFKITGIPISKASIRWGEDFDTGMTTVPVMTYLNGKQVDDSESLTQKPGNYIVKYRPSSKEDWQALNGFLDSMEAGVDTSDYQYKVSYGGNTVDVGKGKAYVTFTGINAYTDTIKKTYNINPFLLTSEDENISITLRQSEKETEVLGASQRVENPSAVPQYLYQKGGTKPKVEIKVYDQLLIEGKDYTLSYKNNTQLHDGKSSGAPTVIIKGKGNYVTDGRNPITLQYGIKAANIEQSWITVSDVVVQTKGLKKPTITIADEGGVLKADTDYDRNVKYYIYDSENGLATDEEVDIKNGHYPVGTMLVALIKGKGKYSTENAEGIYSAPFRVLDAGYDISKATITIQPQTYTGKPISLSEKGEDISVVLNKVTLDYGVDYRVVPGSDQNSGNKGTYKAIIEGIGEYGGRKTVSFKIVTKNMLHTVKYDNNDAWMKEHKPYVPLATGSMKVSNAAAGAKITLSSVSFKRKGYEFVGWNTKPDGSGTDYPNKGIYIVPADEKLTEYGMTEILYAQWIAVEYSIVFEANGGLGKMAPMLNVAYNTSYNLRKNEFVRPGFFFLGWNTDVNGEGEFYKNQGEIKYLAADGEPITLYAQWESGEPNADNAINLRDYLSPSREDDTADFNRAINALNTLDTQCNTLLVPAGEYFINSLTGIRLKSNTNIIMEEGAVLKSIPNAATNYNIIRGKGISNVIIKGGKIIGDRYNHLLIDAPGGNEWGMGIGLYDCKGIMIDGMDISDCWGDGIYLGSDRGSSVKDGCQYITVKNTTCHNNRRNNMSIVCADDVLVDNCNFIGANGTAPQFGIDIETNYVTNPCERIRISNSIFSENKGMALGIITTAKDIKIDNCELSGDFNNFAGEGVCFSNTTITGIVDARRPVSLENTTINCNLNQSDTLIANKIINKRVSRTGYEVTIKELTDNLILQLEHNQYYRFEYDVKGIGEWGIKTNQSTWYFVSPNNDKHGTCITTLLMDKEITEDTATKIIFFPNNNVTNMYLEIKNIRIYSQ